MCAQMLTASWRDGGNGVCAHVCAPMYNLLSLFCYPWADHSNSSTAFLWSYCLERELRIDMAQLRLRVCRGWRDIMKSQQTTQRNRLSPSHSVAFLLWQLEQLVHFFSLPLWHASRVLWSAVLPSFTDIALSCPSCFWACRTIMGRGGGRENARSKRISKNWLHEQWQMFMARELSFILVLPKGFGALILSLNLQMLYVRYHLCPSSRPAWPVVIVPTFSKWREGTYYCTIHVCSNLHSEKTVFYFEVPQSTQGK